MNKYEYVGHTCGWFDFNYENFDVYDCLGSKSPCKHCLHYDFENDKCEYVIYSDEREIKKENTVISLEAKIIDLEMEFNKLNLIRSLKMSSSERIKLCKWIEKAVNFINYDRNVSFAFLRDDELFEYAYKLLRLLHKLYEDLKDAETIEYSNVYISINQ